MSGITKSKRSQAFLRELLAALDGLPEKRLTSELLECDGDYCAVGSIIAARGMDPDSFESGNTSDDAERLGVSEKLLDLIVNANDIDCDEREEARHTRMRAWVASQIKEPNT